MAALECIGGFDTAPNTGGTVDPNSGDSFTIRNAPQNAYLLNVWTKNQTAGSLTIKSPRLHDNNKGLYLYAGTTVQLGLPMGTAQPLLSQDTLSLTVVGSGTGGDIESCAMLIYYPSLPGSDGRFIDLFTLNQRFVNYYTQYVAITAGTSGGWSGSAAINSTSGYDNMKANTDYALIGIQTTVAQCTIALKGADTGSIRLGVPGMTTQVDNTRFFYDLAFWYKLPLIPVINSANKANTYVEVQNDENGASPLVRLIMAELRS